MHLTTIFPEIRLKRYIEMRGGDGGPPHMITALSAFWIGLLYSQYALSLSHALILLAESVAHCKPNPSTC